jgi:hypothetical protein
MPRFRSTTQRLVSAVAEQGRTNRRVDAIVGAAQSTRDPVKVLDALDAGYAIAPANIKQAVLAGPSARKIINAAVHWANEPLRQTPPVGMLPQGPPGKRRRLRCGSRSRRTAARWCGG